MNPAASVNSVFLLLMHKSPVQGYKDYIIHS